jgi:hypothetical protein
MIWHVPLYGCQSQWPERLPSTTRSACRLRPGQQPLHIIRDSKSVRQSKKSTKHEKAIELTASFRQIRSQTLVLLLHRKIGMADFGQALHDRLQLVDITNVEISKLIFLGQAQVHALRLTLGGYYGRLQEATRITEVTYVSTGLGRRTTRRC